MIYQKISIIVLFLIAMTGANSLFGQFYEPDGFDYGEQIGYENDLYADNSQVDVSWAIMNPSDLEKKDRLNDIEEYHTASTNPFKMLGSDYCWDESVGKRASAASVNCPTGYDDYQDLLCYKKCAPGYSGAATICWRKCPSGWNDFGVGCSKPSYGRGVGRVPDVYCPPNYDVMGVGTASWCYRWWLPHTIASSWSCKYNEELKDGLCYTKCQSGYTGTITECTAVCPSGFTNSIYTCTKTSYGRPVGVIPYGPDAKKYHAAKAIYENGIGNMLQDGWNDSNYGPVLSNALKNYITEKFAAHAANKAQLYTYIKGQIQNKDGNCSDCKIARYEFVGFFIGEYLKVLRNGSNLNRQLNEYVAYQMAKASRETLDNWVVYTGKTALKLNDSGSPLMDALAQNPYNGSFDQPTYYNNGNTLSVFVETAVPLPGKSVAEFKESNLVDPMQLSRAQQQVMVDFMMPVTAHANMNGVSNDLKKVPDYLFTNVQKQSQALNIATSIGTQAGVAAGVGAIPMFSVGLANIIPQVSKGIFTITTNAAIKAAEIATTVAAHGGTYAGSSVSPITSQVAANLAGKAITQSMGPIMIGVAVFMAGFMPTGGKAIEIAIFEEKLVKDSYLQNRTSDWYRMSEGEKIMNFNYAFRMLVLDGGFSYLVPGSKADAAEQQRIVNAATGNTGSASATAPAEDMKAFENRFVFMADYSNYGGKTNNRINTEKGPVRVEPIHDGAWSAHWTLKNMGGNYYQIQNRWKGTKLHIGTGELSASSISDSDQKGHWRFEPVAGKTGGYKVVNKANPAHVLYWADWTLKSLNGAGKGYNVWRVQGL